MHSKSSIRKVTKSNLIDDDGSCIFLFTCHERRIMKLIHIRIRAIFLHARVRELARHSANKKSLPKEQKFFKTAKIDTGSTHNLTD